MKNIDKMSERELRNSVKRLRAALVAIQANSAPKAISLSPRNRIRAFYKISSQALAEEE